jgi:tRNA A-37 threonylcarbamoyl transferase component Bud32
MAGEARVMDYVRSHGYPAPAVEEISPDGLELVMERIDGPSMVEGIKRRPWSLHHQGALLATLHRRLHDIAGPEWLPVSAVGTGEVLVHLDLHPLNVILSPTGPVVIDWPNARRGDGAVDVALTWVLLASGDVPTGALWGAIMAKARQRLIAGFMSPFDRGAVTRELRAVVTWKVKDPHMSEVEQARMWSMVDAAEVDARGNARGVDKTSGTDRGHAGSGTEP